MNRQTDSHRQSNAISVDTISSFNTAFASDPRNRLAQNAVTQVGIDDAALNREILTGISATFSHRLDDWTVTDQKDSGRCWLFAGLNLLRANAMQIMNISTLEFSQNYLLFWDKLERANYVLTAMIDLANRPVDDRTVMFILADPLPDAGQWPMFVNLVRKYGIVPLDSMPETFSSSDTRRMNSSLSTTIRSGAQKLRALVAAGSTNDQLTDEKTTILRHIYRILAIHLGTPPTHVSWQWRDRDKKFHRSPKMTTQEFAAEFVSLPLDEYVCLVHDPRSTSPRDCLFQVDRLGNVVEGNAVTYLNSDINLMKDIAKMAIQGGEPVWFGCDVTKQMRRHPGVWDAHLFDYSGVYQVDFPFDKATRLEYRDTELTHAMLFTGVDISDRGMPLRWRVENSWGEDYGQKGFYTMTNSWFEEHVFEIAARRSALPEALQAILDSEPIMLPVWDPMGALAR